MAKLKKPARMKLKTAAKSFGRHIVIELTPREIVLSLFRAPHRARIRYETLWHLLHQARIERLRDEREPEDEL
jgi:hypothetical protein